jgi:hypothetical protein
VILSISGSMFRLIKLEGNICEAILKAIGSWIHSDISAGGCSVLS